MTRGQPSARYNCNMLDAPQHDWSFYESKTQASDAECARNLTFAERFALYASLFNMIWNSRQNLSGNWEQSERERWEEKLEVRRRMVDAFRKLDELRRERSAANDSTVKRFATR